MARKRKRLVIFTDLDGTLLDAETYSFEEALPALEQIRKRRIPLVLCSSKTRAEIEFYQKKLKLNDPFVSENGGAVFIHPGYFSKVPDKFKKKGQYLVWELGTPYPQIRDKFREILTKLNLKAIGFGDMGAEEISSMLNLSAAEAKLAKKREYDEPFYFPNQVKENEIKLAEKELKKNGLSLTAGGRLFHLTGDNDKGKAVKLLSKICTDNWGDAFLTVGLGDGPNDLSLLQSVDIPILLRKQDNSYEQSIVEKLKVRKAGGVGPQGWNKAVIDLMEEYG